VGPPPHSSSLSVAAMAVILHVYHVGDTLAVQQLNTVLKRFGVGAFHAGIEVFNREYSYGAGVPGCSGVCACCPGRCEQHVHLESMQLGVTPLPYDAVMRLVKQLSLEWLADDYAMVGQNCVDFCEEFCSRLRVGSIPSWVGRLASTGAALNPTPAFEEALAHGKRARGAKDDDEYEFGDLSRGIGLQLGIVDAVSVGLSPVVQRGKLARGASALDFYEFGDFSRGVLAAGKQSRGASMDDGYKFGDITRGLVRSATGL